MRYTDSNCVGCETCRCCGRNIEKAFFVCDECDTVVAGDIEIGSDDDYEESWLNEAPDGSGHMWCDYCVKKWKEEDLEERYGNNAMDVVEKLRGLVDKLSFDMFILDGKWHCIALWEWKGHSHMIATDYYTDYMAMFEDLEKQADKVVQTIKQSKEKSA